MTTARQRLTEEERRTQILRATITVVARDGFDSATTERIAEQAGVSKGLLWHYFADKNDLLKQSAIETVRAIAEEVTADMDGIDSTGMTTRDRMRAGMRRTAKLSETHREELRAVTRITHSLRAPDGSPAFSNADYEESHQRNEARLRLGQAQGILGSFDPRVMAVTRQGAVDMMLLYFDSHPGTDIEKYADELADFLLAATKYSGD